MNRYSDFIMTEGGQRVGHHLHRITPIGQPVDHCDPCHGNCVVCAQAQSAAEKAPAGILRVAAVRLVAAVVLVAVCFGAALFGFTLALPKPAPELPRATAKVTT